ncbi:MAG: adenosylmethionine decarboxylase, partial [Desulfovibrionales bacterium]|nr:adenosylmethionine decarboxylase [Desulfovibrionales bacterium]
MKSLYPPGHIAPGFTLGRHLTVEYYGCASHSFLSLESVQQKMEDAARAARAHIVSSLFHPFEPQGISGVVVITESHLALHAWPEYDYAAVDIFTCSNSMDVSAAVDYLAQAFGAARVEISSVVDRGVFPLNKESIPKGGADRFDLECPGPNSHGQDPQNSRE